MDMIDLEHCVRAISQDGLVWGESSIVPVRMNLKSDSELPLMCRIRVV